MEEERQSKPNSLVKLIISVILIIAGIALIIWFFYVIFSGEEVVFNGVLTNLPEKTVNDSEITNSSSERAIEIIEDGSEIKARDEQRITHIEKIRSALKKYYNDNGNYPEKMEELVTGGYLSKLPKNPTPGGIDYVYTPIGSLPAKYYDLAYSLEVGTSEISAGEHIANPDSIAYP